ncbi:MAG: sulfatase [bacterium]|nr:sulfatase [bacterium]
MLLAVATASAQMPQPGQVRIASAIVAPDTAAAGATGRVRLNVLMRRVDVVPALVEGRFRVRVQDGAAFDTTIVPTGCRAVGRRLRCRERSSGLTLRLRVRSAGGEPTWDMRLVAKRLGDAQTGTRRPQAPLRVLFEGLGRDAVTVRLRGCSPQGARSLECGASRPPNVVVIVTDDQRWDSLGFMPVVQSRLAGEGMRFDNAFVSTPVCCPSRATILTGLWAHNHGTHTLVPPNGGATKFVGADTSTMATWLQAAGYRTGFFGKYLNGYRDLGPPAKPTWYVPPGWSRWRAMREESYFDFDVVGEDGLVETFTGRESYSTDVLRDQALAFMDEALAADEPFLVHFTPFGPHSARDSVYPRPAPRHEGLFGDMPLPLPPNFEEVDVGDKPQSLQALPLGHLLRIGISRESHRRHAATLQSIDEAVDAMLGRLEAAGALDDTVVIFTSDNGFTFGEHRLHLRKLCGFEECIRVPFVVRAPGFAPAGTVSARLVQNIDIAPTVAALAGVVPPALVDGRSVVPLLLGEEAGWRWELLFEQWQVFDNREFVALRTETWKFIEDITTGEQELYDLVGDPWELENRAAARGYETIRDALRTRAFALFAASPGEH